MEFAPKLHHRRSIRLQTYDYTQAGAYFITLCTYKRQHLFGEVRDGKMLVNLCGQIVEEEWLKSATIRKEIRTDAFIVMPNHVHGIVFIDQIDAVGAHGCAPRDGAPRDGAPRDDAVGDGVVQNDQQPVSDVVLFRPRRSLGSFIAGFKSAVTAKINSLQQTPGIPVWQRNYYDHIIRKAESLERIRQYIAHNPQNWDKDKNNNAENVWM